MGFIYTITNNLNGKVYVGKTEHSDPIERWREHIADYTKDRCKDRALYRAFNKYGVENFSFNVIDQSNDSIQLSKLEEKYIESFNSYHAGYNMTFGGDGKTYIDSDKLMYVYTHTLSVSKTSNILGCHPATVSDKVKHLIGEDALILKDNEIQIAALDIVGNIVFMFRNAIDVFRHKEFEHYKGDDMHKAYHIRQCLKGERKKAYGYSWKVVSIDEYAKYIADTNPRYGKYYYYG